MSILSRLGYFVGFVLLLHSGYSSYEFNQFIKATASNLQLPLDIKLEALFGLLVFILSSFVAIINPIKHTILENEPLNSKNSSVSGNDSVFFKPIKMNKAVIELEKLRAGPFDQIEHRPAFIDIVKKRQEFNEWVVNEDPKN